MVQDDQLFDQVCMCFYCVCVCVCVLCVCVCVCFVCLCVLARLRACCVRAVCARVLVCECACVRGCACVPEVRVCINWRMRVYMHIHLVLMLTND